MERLICLVVGYVCGLFQTSYIYGRMHQIDIREHGSGNAGTTNALRTLGKKAGAITLLGDCLKCVLAVLIARVLYGNSHQDMMPLLGLYAAFGCILGHNFPFYLKFHGGKGIAASVGMLIAVDWRLLPICAVVFLSVFLATHYVSLSSISGYVTAFVGMLVFGGLGYYGMSKGHQTEMDIVMLLMTALAIYRHRENIDRLKRGTENKLYLSKVGKK
ncbi:MAG: glycerol-3-phosphate 1-O-acyltransferase PlsY [Blautia sp.]|jgi:glycerol-3-phosphate acyltransferase PlsY